MNVKFEISVLTAALSMFLLLPTPVQAQGDAGSKIRGDRGRYSGRTDVGRADFARPTPVMPRMVSPQPSYAPQPPLPAASAQPAVDPYEAYSLQPLPFSVGDTVRVQGETALMRGRRSLGTVPAGQQLQVLKIRGPWVGVAAEIGGREVGGWLWYSQVTAADADSAP